jgi:multiple sugar transport system ATP-binding protein
MVFQNYALYPHMTVYKNMAFGLQLRKVSRDFIDAQVQDAAKILDIALSPEPQAEGAFGRPAPARRARPRDGAQSRRLPSRRAAFQSRRQAARHDALRNHQAAFKRLNATFIYVTHDQVEAMTMATGSSS